MSTSSGHPDDRVPEGNGVSTVNAGALPTAANGSSRLPRRRFLAMGGGVALGAALTACTNSSELSTARPIGPHSSAVAAAERARQVPGAGITAVRLATAAADIDIGGVRVSTWTYGGVPGKEVRVQRGERLRIDLSNALPESTTVHWHGLAIRNDMDGVPDLTQSAVVPGGRFRYEFTVPESGTFWFHPTRWHPARPRVVRTVDRRRSQ